MIHRVIFSAAIILVPSAGIAAQQTPRPGGAAAERRVDSLFRVQIRPDGPGCAVGAYRDGQVLVAKGYGLANAESRAPITAQTAFNLGSAGKPFTTIAALMLVRDEKLSLDDDVRRWIPELPDYGTTIRVRDLLQHTSGLRDYGAFSALTGRSIASMPEFLGRMAAQRALNFAPGTRHEYSHSDFTLLGIIIERIVGIPLGEHIEQAVLAPMGMRGSFVHDERPRVRTNRAVGHATSMSGMKVIFPGGTITGGSGVYASVTDLAHFIRNFDDPRVGGVGVINQMLSRPTLASGETIPYAWGLRRGAYRGLPMQYRGGHDDGMSTVFMRFPALRFGVAVLCNAEHLEAFSLARGVADIYLAGLLPQPAPVRPVAPPPVAVSPEELTRYAGLYRSTDVPWVTTPFVVRDGVLHEVLFDATRDDTMLVMTPAGNGRFYEIGLTGNVGIFEFTPTPDGGMRFTLSWNGQVAGEGERIPDSLAWRPGQALGEYEGTWYSAELDAGWQLVNADGRLVLRRPGARDLTLRPVERDVFNRGFGPWTGWTDVKIEFHRNAAGAVTHFTVSTPPGEDSAVGIRFLRVER